MEYICKMCRVTHCLQDQTSWSLCTIFLYVLAELSLGFSFCFFRLFSFLEGWQPPHPEKQQQLSLLPQLAPLFQELSFCIIGIPNRSPKSFLANLDFWLLSLFKPFNTAFNLFPTGEGDFSIAPRKLAAFLGDFLDFLSRDVLNLPKWWELMF